MHQITIPYPSYNQHHYGRPWIARLYRDPQTHHLLFHWGATIATRAGDPGWLQICAPTNAILCVGQSSYRTNHPHSRIYYNVTPVGTLLIITHEDALRAIARGVHDVTTPATTAAPARPETNHATS